MIRLWIALGLITFIGATISGGYLYIQRKDNRIEALQTENGQLRTVIETKDDALAKKDEQLVQKERETDSLLQSMQTLAQNQSDMQDQMNKIRSQSEEAQRIFAEHDVPKLMDAKPEWMTKIMQKGTREKWEGFRQALE